MGYSPPKCICNAPKKTHIQVNALSYLNFYLNNSYPESSLTPSHLPKPRMRIIIFQNKDVVFNSGLPSDISSGPTPMLYLVDYPPMYINWADSDD